MIWHYFLLLIFQYTFNIEKLKLNWKKRFFKTSSNLVFGSWSVLYSVVNSPVGVNHGFKLLILGRI
ncbi:hypothetical protein [Spiroplasma endosymbiont of Ammophila pubescens]|uniref:hypothetical protein n=1 Tax=Spiroplasma endosymbiont of Ammophila pubescens TaxID=3066315 RepID=UPI0032B1978C